MGATQGPCVPGSQGNQGIMEAELDRDLRALSAGNTARVVIMDHLTCFFQNAAATLPPTPFKGWSDLQQQSMFMVQPNLISVIADGEQANERISGFPGFTKVLRRPLKSSSRHRLWGICRPNHVLCAICRSSGCSIMPGFAPRRLAFRVNNGLQCVQWDVAMNSPPVSSAQRTWMIPRQSWL